MKSYKWKGPFGPYQDETPEYKYRWKDSWGREFGLILTRGRNISTDTYEIFFGVINYESEEDPDNFDVEVHYLPRNSNAFLTISTTVKIIQDFLIKHKPYSIFFSTDVTDDNNANLRNKIFNRYFDKYSYINPNYFLIKRKNITIFKRKQ